MDMGLRFFEAIFENSVSTCFALIISLVFVLAILAQFTERFRRFEGLYRSGPTLLPTLGVLGTFVGIALGLLDFDVSNIDKSVPPLLEGLKVAFMTSIIGLGAAVLLRVVQIATPKPETEETEVTPEVIHTALTAIKGGIDTAAAQQQESLENLRKSISSDGDSSLLTQVQKLRTDFKDGQSELIREFRQFAETMAENNSKALIQALEQVIRDFNTQLNEQFGENFKQLNEAVGALLGWQENYRAHVEALENRLEVAVRAVESSEQALSKISDHTKQIPETLQNLRDILRGLDEHLTTVAGLRDKAIEAFPVIDANLTKLTTDLTEAVGQAIQRSENALQHQQDAHNKLHQGFQELTEKTGQVQDQFESSLNAVLDNISRKTEEQTGLFVQSIEQAMQKGIQVVTNELNSLTEGLEQAVHQAMDRSNQTLQRQQDAHDKLHQGFDALLRSAQHSQDNFDKALSDALTKTAAGIEGQFERLNREMGQTLHQSIEEMGGHLTSLSEKFVKDYNPLTDRLRDVVQMASRIRN